MTVQWIMFWVFQKAQEFIVNYLAAKLLTRTKMDRYFAFSVTRTSNSVCFAQDFALVILIIYRSEP